MQIVKCNICKKIKKEKFSISDRESKWLNGHIYGRGRPISFDLCGKCSENLLKYLKRYLKINKAKS